MKKEIIYIGLGKMGYNMCLNLIDHDWKLHVYNRSFEKAKQLENQYNEVTAYNNLNTLLQSVEGEKIVWIMVPHMVVDEVLDSIKPLLNKNDIVIEGGNSFYKKSIERAKKITELGMHYVDVGVSGGPSGARSGASMMIGGDKSIVKELNMLFYDLCVENGFAHMGDSGAGHFVKMVHNGIEYGMMQAIGEGFELMKNSGLHLDLQSIADVYNHGTVIESRLIGWLSQAYKEHGVELDSISGKVNHSGEGLWTVETAKELGIPVENIKQSLDFRIQSQENPSYTGQVVSALRNQFGGHDVSK